MYLVSLVKCPNKFLPVDRNALEKLRHADANYLSALNTAQGGLLQGTREEILQELSSWAHGTNQKLARYPVYILSGAAGTLNSASSYRSHSTAHRNRQVYHCVRGGKTTRRRRHTWSHILLLPGSSRLELYATRIQHDCLPTCEASIVSVRPYCRSRKETFKHPHARTRTQRSHCGSLA